MKRFYLITACLLLASSAFAPPIPPPATGTANTFAKFGSNKILTSAIAGTDYIPITGVPSAGMVPLATDATHAGWDLNSFSNLAGNADLTSQVTGLLPVANGGTGTATPALVQGTNVTITGTWPNQTINASGGGGTPGGSNTQVQYNNSNAFGGISGATTDGSALTLTTPFTVSGAPIVLSGNQSAASWTTNGIRLKGVAATMTDTTSTGTVTAEYTDVLGGNTIAASSATTFTKYISLYVKDPVQGTNVTFTNKYSLGADSAIFGTSNQLTISTSGVLTATSPKIATSILDTNGAGLFALTATGSAVNGFTFANAASGGSALETINSSALGVTATDGLQLINPTAAAAGAQQVSPAVHWTGQGWKTTATAATQSVDFRAYVLPVQGATNPTGLWSLVASVNGGAYSTILTGSTGGIVSALSGLTVGGDATPINNAAGGLGTTAKKWSQLFIDQTITTGGTTGNQTINKAAGTVNVAAAGTSVVVTDSLCTTSSIVFAALRTNDSTATLKNVVPAAGSFTITLTAAATAEVSIGFFVLNQ